MRCLSFHPGPGYIHLEVFPTSFAPLCEQRQSNRSTNTAPSPEGELIARLIKRKWGKSTATGPFHCASHNCRKFAIRHPYDHPEQTRAYCLVKYSTSSIVIGWYPIACRSALSLDFAAPASCTSWHLALYGGSVITASTVLQVRQHIPAIAVNQTAFPMMISSGSTIQPPTSFSKHSPAYRQTARQSADCPMFIRWHRSPSAAHHVILSAQHALRRRQHSDSAIDRVVIIGGADAPTGGLLPILLRSANRGTSGHTGGNPTARLR